MPALESYLVRNGRILQPATPNPSENSNPEREFQDSTDTDVAKVLVVHLSIPSPGHRAGLHFPAFLRPCDGDLTSQGAE